MVLFHPSIQIFNLKDALRLFYYNTIHFSVRRFVFMLLAIPILSLIVVLNFIFRILDEVLYPSYRSLQIKQPVFIISTPRSGTTLLYNLISEDSRLFTAPKLYETIISSISYRKFMSFINRISFGFAEQLVNRINGMLFVSWEGIHPMGFNKAEEDEGFWFFSLYSPAISLLTPYYGHFQHLNVPDDSALRHKKILGISYKNFIKRIYFGKTDRCLLIKSVLSSGRIEMIKRLFPDARYIVLERDLNKAINSYVHMFTRSWKFHSLDAREEDYRAMRQSIEEMNGHLKDIISHFSANQLYRIRYEDFIADPVSEVQKIYGFLNVNFDHSETQRLTQVFEHYKDFKSKTKSQNK